MLAIFIVQSNAKSIMQESIYLQELPACHFDYEAQRLYPFYLLISSMVKSPNSNSLSAHTTSCFSLFSPLWIPHHCWHAFWDMTLHWNILCCTKELDKQCLSALQKFWTDWEINNTVRQVENTDIYYSIFILMKIILEKTVVSTKK